MPVNARKLHNYPDMEGTNSQLSKARIFISSEGGPKFCSEEEWERLTQDTLEWILAEKS